MKAKEVLSLLKISRVTLYRYVKSGKIKTTLLPNGYYDYDISSVEKLLGKSIRSNVIYACVSTQKQKLDLQRQMLDIKQFCKNNNISIDKIYSDISSGIDFHRPQFSNLLKEILDKRINTIYITYKDRLSRLSFKTLEDIFNKFGTQIIPINNKYSKNKDEELFEDLISLMHYFSTKQYSHRRKTNLDLKNTS